MLRYEWLSVEFRVSIQSHLLPYRELNDDRLSWDCLLFRGISAVGTLAMSHGLAMLRHSMIQEH